jgi:hypothetical protein
MLTGDKYFRVRTKFGDIWLHADECDIAGGQLIFRRKDDVALFVIAAGQWDFCHPADLFDGGAPCVEHWVDIQTLVEGRGQTDGKGSRKASK